MQAQAYGWPVAPAWGVENVVLGTDPTDQPLTSSVKALGGTQKKLMMLGSEADVWELKPEDWMANLAITGIVLSLIHILTLPTIYSV